MMKKKLILSFFFVALGFGVVKAQDLPDKKETLKTVTKVNDYFMKKYADYRTPSFVKNVTRPSNIWTRGVYYEGLMALYSVYPRDDYYKYAVDWSNYHEWGFRNGTTTRNADDYCASQTYIDLYNICPDPERIRKVKANIDMLVNTPQVNDWWWIDAIQMGMPVFAKLGKLTGKQKYFDKMWDMYEYTRNKHGENGMYNQKEGLWWRDQDFDPPYKEPNGKNCYWSRGNGWVYAALVRVLNEIPTDEKHRADYINDFLTMSKAIKNCQRTDGFWNVSMHDESNFGGKETSGTALFVYGMAWGIRTENLTLVCKDGEGMFGEYLKFETITLCPICKKGIIKEMLTNEEIEWLNNYHQTVYEKLSPDLNEEEKVWLQEATASL